MAGLLSYLLPIAVVAAIAGIFLILVRRWSNRLEKSGERKEQVKGYRSAQNARERQDETFLNTRHKLGRRIRRYLREHGIDPDKL